MPDIGNLSSIGIGKKMKNLLKAKNFEKLTKSKKPAKTKAKKTFKTRFFIFKARVTFIYLRKVFTKIIICYHFDPEYYIQIKINIFDYVIGKVLSQMILNLSFTNHITLKHLDPKLTKCKIGQ